VDLRIFTEPQQGATYGDLLAVAQRAEALGFGAFFRSDHYLKMGDVSGDPGPTDAWITLGGIARETSRIRLGTLVTAATFRLPGPLAIGVAQVDEMSGGRVELGIGTGWYDDEHTAYGIPFPPLGERFGILEDQLAIVTGLWETPVGSTFSYEGAHYTVTDSPALPKPVQSPRPPIILGGWGSKRTPRLAARYADEFNLPFPPLEAYALQLEHLDRACEQAGRDPASIVRSVALVTCIGADEAEFARRAKAIGREPDELRANGCAGLPAEAADRLAAFRDAGATRAYLQVLDLADLDHLDLIWESLRD
jgi:F420-dependent oxidoreductase-like protein